MFGLVYIFQILKNKIIALQFFNFEKNEQKKTRFLTRLGFLIS